MPNHVENELFITGDPAERAKFKEFARGVYPWDEDKKEELCCNKFIPAPQEAVADYSKVGYEWCNENWGTKWGAYDIEVQENKKELIYNFLSAWSPPEPVVKAMGEKFPMLTFKLKYYEGGMQFKGVLVVKNGKVVKTVNEDYHGHRGG